MTFDTQWSLSYAHTEESIGEPRHTQKISSFKRSICAQEREHSCFPVHSLAVQNCWNEARAKVVSSWVARIQSPLPSTVNFNKKLEEKKPQSIPIRHVNIITDILATKLKIRQKFESLLFNIGNNPKRWGFFFYVAWLPYFYYETSVIINRIWVWTQLKLSLFWNLQRPTCASSSCIGV